VFEMQCAPHLPHLTRGGSAGRPEDVKVLLGAGAAKETANNDGVSALQAADKNRHEACVELLRS
jgi:ankyrin repeat protein